MKRSQIFLLLLHVLAAGCGGYAQEVLSVTAADVNVNYLTQAALVCMVNYTGLSEPNIIIEKDEGSHSAAMMNTDGSVTATLTIQSADYQDMGQYTCRASLNSNMMSDTFWLSIIEYVPLHVEGVGFGSVSTADQVTVSCPIMGNPGPAIIYWQNEDGENITTAVNQNGPFVNENEELDLSNAPPDEGSQYTCTAVDVTGDTLTQPFVVEVVEKGRSIFTEWYLILVYCVVGVIVLVALVLSIWFAVKVRDSCYRPVQKTVRVKEHVRRSDAFGFHIGRRANPAYKIQEEAIEEVSEP